MKHFERSYIHVHIHELLDFKRTTIWSKRDTLMIFGQLGRIWALSRTALTGTSARLVFAQDPPKSPTGSDTTISAVVSVSATETAA